MKDLLDSWGVRRSYEDHRRRRVDVDPGVAARLLEVMGASEGATPPSPGTIVMRKRRGLSARGAAEIVAEDGGSEPLQRHLPDDLPLGYHRLRYPDGSERPLILAPRMCCPPPRRPLWGWAVQLYSARSRQSWGIGDLSDLATLTDWARSTGAGTVMVNPLHAVAPGIPQQTSPYYPSSRVFRNPLYIDVTGAPGYVAGAGGVTDADIQKLAGTEHIDRNAAYDAKLRALEDVWKAATASQALKDYRSEHGESLTLFATYMSIAEVHGPDRRTWPQELRSPDAPGVQRWQRDHRDRIDFHGWLQWVIDTQLERASAGTAVIHDLAIGVDMAGADAWIWDDVFASGVTIGAPPDEFNTQGQNWGLPPWDPWKLAAADYEPFIRTVRAGFRHAGGLRIDHVMGLFRLWWIPEGRDAVDGAYVSYPYRDLLAILALESHRAGAFVVGEDLGTVEDVVREEMTRHRILSYRLLWFEDDPHSIPPLSLAAVTNHDLPTVAGLWAGSDLTEQHEIGLSPEDEAERGVQQHLRELVPGATTESEAIVGAYAALAAASSRVKLATLEDAFGAKRRPNIPGTADEQRPNWSLPLPGRIEDLAGLELAKRIADQLSKR